MEIQSLFGQAVKKRGLKGFLKMLLSDEVTKEVVRELVEKAEYVDWNKGKRKERFAVFAKSFSKRIESFEGKPVYCFDLRDLERMLKYSK